jgi:replicative DNA helicase
MFAVELLHRYTPDLARREAVKVYDTAPEHLSYAERIDVQTIAERLEANGHALNARSMQHVGPLGDALDLGATVAAAGEAVCQFVLHRALVNPFELAAAKTAIAECQLASSNLLALLDTEEQRKSDAAHDVAKEFLAMAPERFVPLFEDLERHARKRFPHLGPQLDERGDNAVQSK